MAPTITPYGLGMRGNDGWATDERPKNWLETILYLWPNGDMPLTGITSKLKSKTTDDPEFNWWEKSLPSQEGTAAIYKEAALTNLFTTSSEAVAVGEAVYAKVALALAKEFRPGHTVVLRDASDYTVGVNAKVTSVTYNGANSVIGLELRETTTGDTLEDVDTIKIIGNANPEGGAIPDVVSYQPNKLYNYSQIFWTPYQITGTAKQTRLRTEEAEAQLKEETLRLHGIEMEKALIWGKRFEGTGDNGQPERETMGLLQFISTNASDNVFTYTTESATAYAGKAWTTAGMDWINDKLEQTFRYGSDTKLWICGSGAMLGINRLAETFGTINLQPAAAKFGIAVREWVTPFGIILLKTHPLFSYSAIDRNRVISLEPSNIMRRPLRGRDTKFYKDSTMLESSYTKVDAMKPSFMTEVGFEFHHAYTMAVFNGVGLNNTVGT